MIQCFENKKEKCLYCEGERTQFLHQKQQIESIHLPIESIQTVERLNPDEGNYMKI